MASPDADILPLRTVRVAPALGVQSAKVMIVDDEPVNVKVVRKYLQSFGYENFVTETDSLRTMEQVRREQPDVIVLDVMMPRLSGLEILAALQADERLHRIPVIMLTASADAATKVKALELGATDFLAKPVDPNELAPRIRNAIAVKAHQDHLIRYSEQLEEQVRQRTAQLIASRRQVILCLARAAEYRDNETGRHVIRVGCYAAAVARHLGMPEHEVELIEQAAQLHDVGKIGVPDSILLKPGKLDPEEYASMQKHCGFGRRIIEPLNATEFQILRRHTELGASIMDVPGSPVLTMAARIAQTHHERWDGTGYPLGLAGEHIPLEGRITAVADVFDGLSTRRPYKPAFPLDKCFEIMKEGRGAHFDPRVLDAFLAGKDEIIRLQIEYADLD
jgi:putative two-component system response regulator